MRRAAIVLLLSSLGCAHVQAVDGWLSESEPRTWVSHSVVVVAASTAGELVADEPVLGYALGMAGLVGWEVNEWVRHPEWTDWTMKALDLVIPAAVGWLWTRVLR